jgi:hypothetical protein
MRSKRGKGHEGQTRPIVPVRIVVAMFAELKVYRIWVDKGLFAELLGILEEV